MNRCTLSLHVQSIFKIRALKIPKTSVIRTKFLNCLRAQFQNSWVGMPLFSRDDCNVLIAQWREQLLGHTLRRQSTYLPVLLHLSLQADLSVLTQNGLRWLVCLMSCMGGGREGGSRWQCLWWDRRGVTNLIRSVW